MKNIIHATGQNHRYDPVVYAAATSLNTAVEAHPRSVDDIATLGHVVEVVATPEPGASLLASSVEQVSLTG